MPSSLFAKIKLRLLDRALAALRRPSRIDTAAVVAPTATVTSSSLHGPVRVDEHARLFEVEISGPVHIGRGSSLWGPGIFVLARGAPVAIGNFCSIARGVSVHGYGHDSRRISTHYIGRNVLGRPIEDEVVTGGPVTIGHDVWIGAGAHVMSGVSIGTGAIVGAGSVVTRDVPPYAVAVGAPARPVRYRFDEPLIARLLETRWWEWSHEEIRARAGLFLGPLTPELLDDYL
jgi:virginiamycin A acetyltransferase